MPKVPAMPIGRSLPGRATSPASVVTLSKPVGWMDGLNSCAEWDEQRMMQQETGGRWIPMKEKKTVPAPFNEPSNPYGKKGSQLSGSRLNEPTLRPEERRARKRGGGWRSWEREGERIQAVSLLRKGRGRHQMMNMMMLKLRMVMNTLKRAEFFTPNRSTVVMAPTMNADSTLEDQSISEEGGGRRQAIAEEGGGCW